MLRWQCVIPVGGRGTPLSSPYATWVTSRSFHCARTLGASLMGSAKQTVAELITVMSIIRTFHSLGCSDELRAKNTSLIMQLNRVLCPQKSY